MIDYDYENRLVDRIAVNEAATARLKPRQRRILLRYHRYGETLEEVGRREGVTRETIRKVLHQSYRRLRRPFIEAPKIGAANPQQATRNTPPPGFDKAAFVNHMRLLIDLREQHAIWERQEQARREREAAEQARREELSRVARELGREQREFARERAELARLVDGETLNKTAPPSKLPSGNSLKVKLPIQYAVHKADHSVYYSSPSYHPSLPPSEGELSHIAHEALQYLLLTRPHGPLGNPFLGKWCTSVVFPVDGGIASVAVDKINAEIPHHARLSAYQIEIPKGTVGANPKTLYASLRATLTADGLQIRFDVTWD